MTKVNILLIGFGNVGGSSSGLLKTNGIGGAAVALLKDLINIYHRT